VGKFFWLDLILGGIYCNYNWVTYNNFIIATAACLINQSASSNKNTANIIAAAELWDNKNKV